MKETRRVEMVCQLRSEGDKKTAYGTVLTYGEWSKPIHGYYLEKFRAGAFARSLAANPDVYATVEHDLNKLLGRSSSGTLRLTDGPSALTMEVDLPDTSYARDAAALIARQDFRGMSFIFQTVTDDWSMQDGQRTCEIIEANLFEVTFTANPCYEDTAAGLRSRAYADERLINMDFVRRRQWLSENS